MNQIDKKIHENYYTKVNTGNQLRYEWFFKKFLKNVKNKKILEIGCGDGGVIQFLKKDNWVIGVDISKNGVEFLKQEHNMKSFQADISYEKLPFKDESFDVVIILETIEHLKCPHHAIEEIQRVLKKEKGLVIISIPNPKNGHKFLYPALFKFKNFKEYLLNNRFHIKSTSTYGFCPPFWNKYRKFILKKHNKERKESENEGKGKISFFQKIALFMSNDYISLLKPYSIGWSFIYVCTNLNPNGAKEIYNEIAEETKEAYD